MLTKEQIENYLEELNSHLAEEGIIGEVVLCGGAVMTLAYDARLSTKDIDGIFAPSTAIRTIIKTMAVKYNLEEDWFNDVKSLDEVFEILERYIPPARLTPLAGFFAEEIYNRYIATK